MDQSHIPNFPNEQWMTWVEEGVGYGFSAEFDHRNAGDCWVPGLQIKGIGFFAFKELEENGFSPIRIPRAEDLATIKQQRKLSS